jgi:hypothetical protein
MAVFNRDLGGNRYMSIAQLAGRSASPTVVMETITPERAELLLATQRSNRRIGPRVVNKYAADIE